MSDRIEYFDTLKGVAILGVIAIHSSGSWLQFEHNSLNFHFNVLWRNLLNVSVPMFLAISGYFLAKKRIDNLDDYFSFLKKQIPRVYIPLVFWSVVWLSFGVLIQNKSIAHEAVKLVSFQSCGPYYFVALIIQYFILLPVFNRFKNTTGLVIAIVTSMFITGIFSYLRYYTDIRLPLIIYAGNFATWMMFFVLGLCVGSSVPIRVSNRFLIMFAATSYALSCVESYLLISLFHQNGDSVSAVRSFSFSYSFAIIVFLIKNHDLIRSKLLEKIGEKSFGMFLIHTFALMVATRLLSQLSPSLQEISPAYQFSLISIATLLCFLCISIFNKFISVRQSKFIGFK